LNEISLEEFMLLFGPVGPTELLLIVLIIVIIFGARRLPELGKSLGEGIKNFKKSIGKEGSEDSDSDKNPPPSSKD
jgi:sec-independent protein translocase protein TatA